MTSATSRRRSLRSTTPRSACISFEEAPTYTVRWAPFDNRTGVAQSMQSEVETAGTRVAIPAGIWGPPDDTGVRYAVASISTRHPMFTHWASPVVVTIRNRKGMLDVVGIDRQTNVLASSNGSHE